jgi:hypothetical protein
MDAALDSERRHAGTGRTGSSETPSLALDAARQVRALQPDEPEHLKVDGDMLNTPARPSPDEAESRRGTQRPQTTVNMSANASIIRVSGFESLLRRVRQPCKHRIFVFATWPGLISDSAKDVGSAPHVPMLSTSHADRQEVAGVHRQGRRLRSCGARVAPHEPDTDGLMAQGSRPT